MDQPVVQIGIFNVTQYRIELETEEQRLTLEGDGDTTLLELLQNAGLSTRNPCRNGVCGLCKCRLLDGEVTYHWKVPHGLWEKDKEGGFILPCIAYPTAECTLDSLSLIAS